MTRLLLTCIAATALMLTACIDVDLASSAHSVDGARVTMTSTTPDASDNEADGEPVTRNGGDAGADSTLHDDVRLRS